MVYCGTSAKKMFVLTPFGSRWTFDPPPIHHPPVLGMRILTARLLHTASLRTKILDFRGFDSSGILISRGEILLSTGNIPERLSQQILVGIILIGRLGVAPSIPTDRRGGWSAGEAAMTIVIMSFIIMLLYSTNNNNDNHDNNVLTIILVIIILLNTCNIT